MSVKRYDLVGDMDGNCNLNEARMELSDDGVYVKYSEHLLLEQKLTDMAVQLANSESKCRGLAAENAYLLPKAASELSNAWVLHKYLIGIQAAIMYLDGGNKKAAQEWLYGTISGPGFEFPDEVEVGDDIDAWATHQMRDSISYPRAVEIIKAETPATDAFLAEVRSSARNDFIGRIEWIIRNECNPDKTEAIINELQNFSEELKLEAAQ